MYLFLAFFLFRFSFYPFHRLLKDQFHMLCLSVLLTVAAFSQQELITLSRISKSLCTNIPFSHNDGTNKQTNQKEGWLKLQSFVLHPTCDRRYILGLFPCQGVQMSVIEHSLEPKISSHHVTFKVGLPDRWSPIRIVCFCTHPAAGIKPFPGNMLQVL